MNKLPDNPFEIRKPIHALHEINEQREKLFAKNSLTPDEKLMLYRLRIDELLWVLDDESAHFDWLKQDYKELKEKTEGKLNNE